MALQCSLIETGGNYIINVNLIIIQNLPRNIPRCKHKLAIDNRNLKLYKTDAERFF